MNTIDNDTYNPMNMDLDDGIVVNYAKYGDILAKLK